MANATNYLEIKQRDHLFGTATFAKPTILGVALILANRNKWAASTAYVANASAASADYVIPNTANGRIYRCTTSGTSAASEPVFPVTNGGTVTDGTAVWTEATTQIEAGTFREVGAGVGYARAQNNPLDSNWDVTDQTGGAVNNLIVLVYGAATADWGTAFGTMIYDATTGGNPLIFSALAVPRQVLSSDKLELAVTKLAYTFA